MKSNCHQTIDKEARQDNQNHWHANKRSGRSIDGETEHPLETSLPGRVSVKEFSPVLSQGRHMRTEVVRA